MVTDAVSDAVSGAVPMPLWQRDFDSFYRACWNEVYRPLAVTLHDPDLAREAVDEAMIRAYRRWRAVRGYRNQAGWVYRVAFNWAVSHLRKTGREVYGAVPGRRVGNGRRSRRRSV